MVKFHPWQNRIIQVVALIAFASAFVVAVVLLDQYSRDHWVPSSGTIRMVLFTGVTFVAVGSQFRRDWHSRVFWLAMTALLVIHIFCFVLVFGWLTAIPLPVFAAVSLVEIPVLCSLLDRAGFHAQ